MMRLVVLLFFCGVITGNNDTLNNLIPDDEPLDLGEQYTENWSTDNRTVNELFEDAVLAYLEENWDRCIEDFNAVLHGYKVYKRMITNCRKKCRSKADGDEPIFPENIDDLHFYEKKVKETLCLLMCNREYREIAGAKALKTLPRETEQKLVDHRVYEYLHICYYQKKRYQDAANALFTFVVAHPDHETSVQALVSYLTLPGVQADNVVNLETAAYVSIYFKAVSAYENENYAKAVGLFETSLSSYLQAEDECRFYCEGPFDQGWHPEFISSIANHFAYCLKCKQACSNILNNVNGDFRKDMLRNHYDYLQFSYYKLGNLKAACSAVESYLLFDPVDETMLQNKNYYSAQPKVKEEYFTPRQEAVNYLKRREYELALLRYISKEFSIIEAKYLKSTNMKTPKNETKDSKEELGKEPDFKAVLHTPPGHALFSHANLSKYYFTTREHREYKIDDTKQPGVKEDIYLIAKEEDLDGKNRYVADGFLNSTNCESLMKFAYMNAVEGDGYSENKSPHSKYERFEGITIGRTALMVYFGKIDQKWLELFLEKTELVREHVEMYFGLHRHLYFSYTHLVCRTALPGNFHLMHHRASGSFCNRITWYGSWVTVSSQYSPVDRDDLSHQVHADNCLLRNKDTCLRESPAYVWRDYSAILYLNDDFQGGEFFFAKDRVTRELDYLISPRCGRMVAFSAGGENLHGVRGIIRGRRCALALWFTQDKRYLEYERVLASAVLERVRSFGPLEKKNVQVPLKYEDVLVDYANNDESLKYFLRNSS